MRIRTIKPEFWSNEDMARISYKARLLALALLNYCDDEGFFRANPALIKASLFPLDDSVNVPGMILELSGIDYIRTGKGSDGREYGFITKFTHHQRIDKPKKSIIRENCTFQDQSKNDPGCVPSGTGNREQGTGKGESFSSDFDSAWKIYPDKSGKSSAKSAYIKARRDGVDAQTITDGLTRYIAYVRHRQKTDFRELRFKNGGTWFHQRGWEDEYSVPETEIQARQRSTRNVQRDKDIANVREARAEGVDGEQLARLEADIGRLYGPAAVEEARG